MKSLAFKLWSAQGYIRLPNGRVVSGFAHEYERHGTTTLFAALETATGLVKAGHYKRRRRREFLDFMSGVIDSYGSEKEIHVILDDLNTHKPMFGQVDIRSAIGVSIQHRLCYCLFV